MLWTILEHFGPVCCMAVLILGSKAITLRAQGARFRIEAGRLRSALIISLRALRKLHEDNLCVLAGGRPPLISGRNQINLLRLQLGRFILLDQPEIEAVMAATIAAERAETVMAIAGKAVGGAAFTVPGGHEKIGMLVSTLKWACATIETAERLMTPTSIRSEERAFEVSASRDPDAHSARGHIAALSPCGIGERRYMPTMLDEPDSERIVRLSAP